MKTLMQTSSVVSCILFASFLCCSCAFNQTYIKTEGAENSDITGSYTVFLYGANYSDDIVTVAILVPTAGQYTFDIYAPEWAYRTVNGVPGKDAVAMALSFVSWHPSFLQTDTSRILSPSGKVIGYEIRPLYMSTTFGKEDVILVDYLLKDNNRIEVHIHLDYDIEKRLFVTGGDGQDGGK
ncbi:MAG: hypothetical protein ACLPN1_09385 [Dissulfurispiraceae bacterium]